MSLNEMAKIAVTEEKNSPLSHGEGTLWTAAMHGWRWSFSCGFAGKASLAWQPTMWFAVILPVCLLITTMPEQWKYHPVTCSTSPGPPESGCGYAELVETSSNSLKRFVILLRSYSTNSNASAHGFVFHSRSIWFILYSVMFVNEQQHCQWRMLDETQYFELF